MELDPKQSRAVGKVLASLNPTVRERFDILDEIDAATDVAELPKVIQEALANLPKKAALSEAQRVLSEMKTAINQLKGDSPGHPFHGNQWTGGMGGESAGRIPGTDANGKTTDFAARTAYLDKTIQAVQQTNTTDKLYDQLKDAKSAWTPERQAIHQQIVNDVYKRYADVPANKQAIITGGLPGAGKTTGLNKAFEQGWLQGNSKDYVVINPDDMKEELAKRGLVPDDPRLAGTSPLERSSLIHEESSFLAKGLAERAYADNKNVLWDITMNSDKSVTRRLDDLSSRGYSKQMIFTDTKPEIATDRAVARYERGQTAYENGTNPIGGRFVPSDVTGYKSDPTWGTANRATFENLKGRSDAWVSVDLNGASPKLIAKSS